MEPQPQTQYKDCLSCRIIGTGTLSGVGSYAIWQARATAPGSSGQKKMLAGVGVGSFVPFISRVIELSTRSSYSIVGGRHSEMVQVTFFFVELELMGCW